jgi:uncharacterized membrane protein YdjX (TVP38/TMEM64 family)
MSVLNIIRTNKSSFFFLLMLVILPFIASSFIVLFTVKYENQILHFAFIHWIIIYLAASVTMAFALTHTTFIALLGGFFLGWASVLFMLPSYIIASLIGYALAQYIDKGTFLHSISSLPGVSRIMDNLKKNEWLIIFFARISPVLPFAMMNALLSILNADLKKYLLAGSAGMLPRTLLFIWLGMQARNIKELMEHPSDNMASKISFMVLLAVSVFGLFYVFKRIIRTVDQ